MRAHMRDKGLSCGTVEAAKEEHVVAERRVLRVRSGFREIVVLGFWGFRDFRFLGL